MYCAYLLVLFLFLGVDGRQSIDRKSKNNDVAFQPTLEGEANFPTITDDLALDAKQLRKLEIILNDVVTKYLGPLQTKLSLRSTEDGKTGLIKTIRTVGDAICNSIRNLFDKLGLPQSTRRRPLSNYKQADPSNLKVAVYYQLLRVPLELAPVWQSARTQLIRHMQRHNYTRMGYKSVKYELQTNGTNATEEWKILSIFRSIGTYNSNIHNCLQEKSVESFDLKRAIGDLTNFTPEMTGKILRDRLGKRLPRHTGIKSAEYNQLHAFLCHGVANDSHLEYRDCLVEIKRVDGCVHTKLNGTSASDEPVSKTSKDFIRSMKGLNDSCGDFGPETDNASVCRLKKNPKRANEFPFILDFFMGDLKKSPNLERMAREIGSTIKASQMGSEAMTEIATLVETYKNGMEKKKQLLKLSLKDTPQRYRYNRMSDHFTRYRQYCVDFANRTIGHLHGAIFSLENALVDPTLGVARQNLTENARALRCWSGFVESIFGSWSHNPEQFSTTPYTVGRIDRTNESMIVKKRRRQPGLIKASKEVGFVRSSREESLNKLIESMKSLGQSSQPRRSSALVTLANTFLLATMFYESIAVLAAAIYRQDNDPVSRINSVENQESDRWPPRDRRSPPYLIDRENIQPHRKKDEEESLSPMNGTDDTTVSNLLPISEGIDESVGNSSDSEAAIDSIESTTISNQVSV